MLRLRCISRCLTVITVGALLSVGVGALRPALAAGEIQVDAKQVAGQVDLLQGTAIQLGGKSKQDAEQADSYSWELIQGEGATLLNADTAEAIFQAPKIDSDMEIFVVRLSAGFEGQQPSTVQVLIRVHREISEEQKKQARKAMKQAKKEMKREAKRLKSRRGRRIYYNNYYGGGYGSGWNVGFYWGWGWPAYYPIYVPIIIPGPGIDWGPGEGEWNPPVAVPYDELVTEFPAEIADGYLPQDFPDFAGSLPGEDLAGLYPEAYADAMPELFADPMPGGFDAPGFGGAFDEPGFGGGFAEPGFDDFGGGFGGFDEPMIGGGFDIDPFGF